MARKDAQLFENSPKNPRTKGLSRHVLRLITAPDIPREILLCIQAVLFLHPSSFELKNGTDCLLQDAVEIVPSLSLLFTQFFPGGVDSEE